MADSISIHPVAARSEGRAVSFPAIPWYLWASVIGVTSAMVGIHWDISWHRSIGRDTFWTPPHMAIYLCGIIAGISSAYLILATTFGKLPQVRAASVRMWGFYGPLGAFITAWGGVAMLTSAPFDDWWHSAYGLDVKILSPPHTVLASGILGIELGALILVLGYMNRAQGDERRRLNWLYMYLGSMIVIVLQILTMEYSDRVLQHTATFFIAMSIVVPAALLGVASASENRWAATTIASVYTLFTGLLIWILPLFPAQPKLGPVLHPVTQFIPPQFPILMIVPAIALDLVRHRIRNWNIWIQSAICGAVFFGLFAAVQWPFANFLMSPSAANGFFGTAYLDYAQGPNSLEARNLFLPAERNFTELMWIALFVAVATSRIGLGWGRWMRTVKR
jgi:fumarate reductase subunit C